ncbi:MAG: hypothetical protein RKP73_17335, partial [Candidatus Contendobacter sp.]|nr:hypothetical protein [Candidatus Contendobacter sp.]
EEDRKRQVEEDRKRQVEEDRKRQVEEDRKRQVEASQYLARASDDRRNGKYSASLQQIERGLALVPNHEGLLQLREQVRAELEKKNKPHPKPPKPLVEPPKESNPSIEEIKKAVRELGSSLDR